VDLDLLAGLRVAALTGGPVGDPEFAEPREADLVSGPELVGDLLEGRLERPLRLGLAEAAALGDPASQLILVDVRYAASPFRCSCVCDSFAKTLAARPATIPVRS
jgi:hypothetical protein